MTEKGKIIILLTNILLKIISIPFLIYVLIRVINL